MLDCINNERMSLGICRSGDPFSPDEATSRCMLWTRRTRRAVRSNRAIPTQSIPRTCDERETLNHHQCPSHLREPARTCFCSVPSFFFSLSLVITATTYCTALVPTCRYGVHFLELINAPVTKQHCTSPALSFRGHLELALADWLGPSKPG